MHQEDPKYMVNFGDLLCWGKSLYLSSMKLYEINMRLQWGQWCVFCQLPSWIEHNIPSHPASTVLSLRRAPQKWCSSLLYGTRLPLGQRGARLGMDCTVDLLLVLVWDKTASGTARSKTENRQLSSAMLLLAVPEAVSSHTKTRSRDKLCSSFSVLLLAVPEAVLSHTKTRRISSTRS